MIGKSGQNGFIAVDYSILGQPPRHLFENRILGKSASKWFSNLNLSELY
jgi:hypothetical protein